MLYDYLLLVSATSNIFDWAYKDRISAEMAANLIGATVLAIGALRILGSTAFHDKTRFRKALLAALGFAANLAQGNPYSVLILTILAFLFALIPFGLYIMISSIFADARKDPSGHARKVTRIGVGIVIFAVLFVATAPYLESVVPKWNPPEAFFKPAVPRAPVTPECPGIVREIILDDQWTTINADNRCTVIWSPPTEGTAFIGEPHNYYEHAQGQMFFRGKDVRVIYARAKSGRARFEYKLCPSTAQNC